MNRDSKSPAIFTYPRWKQLRTSFEQLAIVLLFQALFITANSKFFNQVIFWPALLILLLWFAWHILGHIQCSSSITIDSAGIHQQGKLGIETSLSWQEILVRSDWSQYSLVLHDALNDKTIALNPELDNFCDAIEMVRQHRPDLWRIKEAEFQYAPPPALFARLSLPSRLTTGQFIVLLLIPSVASDLVYGASQLTWISLGMIGLILIGHFLRDLFSPRKFSLTGSELVLHYWVGKWRSTASEIHRIALQTVVEPFHQIYFIHIPFIQLWMRKRKDVNLRGPWVGRVWAYCILRTWLENYQPVKSK